jgi:hypothetical protein
MNLARAPRRAPLTARKKGSGYENGTASEIRLPFLRSSSGREGPVGGGGGGGGRLSQSFDRVSKKYCFQFSPREDKIIIRYEILYNIILYYYIVVSKNNKENEHLIDIFTSGDLVMEKISLCISVGVRHCLYYIIN